MTVYRYLAAISFLIFCVTGLAGLMEGFKYMPPYMPFLAAIIFPAIVGITIFIADPRQFKGRQ